MAEFSGASWTVVLPLAWQGTHEEECDSIFNEDGVGVLQLSAYKKPSQVSEQDLEDFATEHIEAGAKTKFVEYGEFSGLTLSFCIDNEYWRYWYLRVGSLALLVTYNCDAEDQNVEVQQVNAILGSLRLI